VSRKVVTNAASAEVYLEARACRFDFADAPDSLPRPRYRLKLPIEDAGCDTRQGPQIFAGDILKLNAELRSFRGQVVHLLFIAPARSSP
jgi:hypothetical protein